MRIKNKLSTSTIVRALPRNAPGMLAVSLALLVLVLAPGLASAQDLFIDSGQNLGSAGSTELALGDLDFAAWSSIPGGSSVSSGRIVTLMCTTGNLRAGRS